MREFERGMTSFFPAGFEDLEASRRTPPRGRLRITAPARRRRAIGSSASSIPMQISSRSTRRDARRGSSGAYAPLAWCHFLLRRPGIARGPGGACRESSSRSRRFGRLWTQTLRRTRSSVARTSRRRASPQPRRSHLHSRDRRAACRRLHRRSDAANAAGPGGPDAFFLLSSAYEVEMEWFRNNGPSVPFAALVQPEHRRLPLFLDQAVRRLTASWNFSRLGTCVDRMSQPLHGLALRVVPMVRKSVYVRTSYDLATTDRADDRLSEEAKLGFRISSRRTRRALCSARQALDRRDS